MKEKLWEIQDGKIVHLTHPTQIRIMELASRIDIRTLSLRQIARIVGINNPQSVKYHISQIAKKGFDFGVVGLSKEGETK